MRRRKEHRVRERRREGENAENKDHGEPAGNAEGRRISREQGPRRISREHGGKASHSPGATGSALGLLVMQFYPPCSLLGSLVLLKKQHHSGIHVARKLEWVAISWRVASRGSSPPRD